MDTRLIALEENVLYEILTEAFLWGELAGIQIDSKEEPISCDDVIIEIVESLEID